MNKNHKSKEKSLVLIKPDGVQRSLIGEIVKRYERTGLKLVALKFFIPTPKLVEKHYLIDDRWLESVGGKTIESYKEKGQKAPFSNPIQGGKWVLEKLKKFLSSGPIIAMVWQGNEAVGIVRKITGGTEPLSSDVGTIRGDLTLDSYPLADTDARAIRNLVHASGSPQEAAKEIRVWFKPNEIVKYRLIPEAILYDVNLDGIKE
ncbi:MAG: nucleoside-diphosphate kinase [Parcubacteria group bacterium]|jgi:nucleoside-diphosphate kinase|nr:nucleoside-diphosphate kinase [Parcubacteria group bacterium]|tara:strand:+ start:2666 stop:3277 length:612 start_codon:yes stop_codon:yes gene_type:complete